MPGFARKHVAFWDEVVLEGHPLRDELISYLRDRIRSTTFCLILPGSIESSSVQRGMFSGSSVAVFANRIPSSHASFVDTEMKSLVERGCAVKWSDVRGPSEPVRPRLIQELSVEETKPRLIYHARPLNQR